MIKCLKIHFISFYNIFLETGLQRLQSVTNNVNYSEPFI